jgi:hypothetical protein
VHNDQFTPYAQNLKSTPNENVSEISNDIKNIYLTYLVQGINKTTSESIPKKEVKPILKPVIWYTFSAC